MQSLGPLPPLPGQSSVGAENRTRDWANPRRAAHRDCQGEAAGWLRQHVPWPETGAWIGERLPRVINDRGLIRALADVIEEYEDMAVDAADRALVPTWAFTT